MHRLAEIAVTVAWGLIWISALALVAWLSDAPKRRRRLLLTSLLFAPLPIWWWGSYPYYEYVAKRDYAVFQELCAKHAGDKINRRVEGVEAVFQMKARDSSAEITHKRNQYTMEDPFGAIGDVGSGRSPRLFLGRSSESKRYEIFERPKNAGAVKGPPYLQFVVSKKADVDRGPVSSTEVNVLSSRYGYRWEDLSTEDMRRRWIAGGRIQIMDLQSGQLIAERTGFVFARDLNGGLAKYPWVGLGLTCPEHHATHEFVMSVLIPRK
jgi:hypothetical protein